MKNEMELLKKLQEIQEGIEGALRQDKNFAVKTTDAEGVSYTFDRESYLQVCMEIAIEEIDCLRDEIAERMEQKSKFTLLK